MKDNLKRLQMAQRARAAYAESMRKDRKENDWDNGTVQERAVVTSAGKTGILLYWPKQKRREDIPVFVNIHGGGFIQGSAGDDAKWCCKIAEAVGCAVVNIDYHLAPEFPFPVALEECYDVLKWIQSESTMLGLDPRRMAVGGHSAGGNLTAALCLLARERQEFSILYQVLNYPPLDFTVDPFSKPSGDTLLTARAQEFFTSCYIFDPEQRRNPLASPLLAESLAGLPDALVISAEYDPLCAENALYARRLSAAGVNVTYKVFARCMHAFTHFGPEPEATEAWTLIHEKLREAFSQDRKVNGDPNAAK